MSVDRGGQRKGGRALPLDFHTWYANVFFNKHSFCENNYR